MSSWPPRRMRSWSQPNRRSFRGLTGKRRTVTPLSRQRPGRRAFFHVRWSRAHVVSTSTVVPVAAKCSASPRMRVSAPPTMSAPKRGTTNAVLTGAPCRRPSRLPADGGVVLSPPERRVQAGEVVIELLEERLLVAPHVPERLDRLEQHVGRVRIHVPGLHIPESHGFEDED